MKEADSGGGLSKGQKRLERAIPVAALLFVGFLGLLYWLEYSGRIHMRERAARTRCVSLLKETMLGVMMYANDWDDLMPPELAMLEAIGYPGKIRCGGGGEFVYLDFGNILEIPDLTLPVLICPWHLNYGVAGGKVEAPLNQEPRFHTCDEFVRMLGRELPAEYLEKLRRAWD